MANKILNTRVLLRYDSYTNWDANKSSIPLKGEMCICTSGTINPTVDDVLLKVGNGTTTWELLPWVSAKAADVHDWAKLSWTDFEKKFAAGNYLEVEYDGTHVTYKHKATTVTETSSTDTPDHGDSFTVIDTIETDGTVGGHITKINTKTITLPSIESIEDSITHTVVDAGAKIDVDVNTVDKTTTYTVSHEATTREDGDVVQKSLLHDDTFTVITSVESDATGHVTAAKKTTFTLPKDENTTYDLKTANSTTDGKLVLDPSEGEDDVVSFVGSDAVSVISDTSGKITISSHDTKSSLKTTTGGKLVLQEDSVDKSTISFSGDGATTVTSDANGNFTISSHDTQFDISASQSGSNADINLNKDDAAFDKVTLAAGENVTLTVSGDVITVSAKDDDTKYTAGDGLNLSGTEFSHAIPTKVAGNVSGSDRTYIKSVSFDKFGHVTEVATGTETVVDTDTKTTVESGDKYISVSGDLTENAPNTFTVSVVKDELIKLIGEQTTAAMEFKGATAVLPSEATKGDMYKVSGSFSVAGETAKVGDAIVYDGTEWYLIPSGDDIEDTWRQVIVDGKNLGGTGDGKTLKFVDGDSISVELDADGETVSFNHNKPSKIDNKASAAIARTYVDSVTVDEYGHVTAITTSSETIEHNPDLKTVLADTGTFTAVEDGDSFKIAGDGSEITTSVSGDTVTVAHATHLTAGSVSGTNSTAPVAHGSKITIPSVTYNAAGHITATSTTEFQLPTNTEVTVKENPDSASLIVSKTVGEKDDNGNDTVEYNIYHKQYETADVTKVSDRDLAHGNTFTAITGLTFEEGHVDTVGVTTYTLPTESNGFATVTPANSTATTAITKNTTSVTADSSADTLTIAAGNKWVELAGDSTNDKITIAHAIGTAGQAGELAFDSTTGVLTVPGAKWDEAGHIVSDVSRTIDLSALKPTKDNDTTGKNIVGASTSAKENAAVAGTSANGVTVDGETQKIYSADGVHLNHVETLDAVSTVVSSHKISGDGFIAVKSDASGNITVGVEQTEGDTLILVCGGASI